MIEKKIKIFIIDNELEICNLLKDFFDFIGYESRFETDGEKAMEMLEHIEYDIMFVDLRLDPVSGIDILKKSKAVKPLSEVIIVTGFGSEEIIIQTLRYGALTFIEKPISFSEVKVQTEMALARLRFNSKSESIKKLLYSQDTILIKHFEDIIHLDKLSEFINLTIDFDVLADSILLGMSYIIPGHYYSFLFFDEINKEMVISSQKPINKNMVEDITGEIKYYIEKLANVKIDDTCKIRLSIPSDKDKKSTESTTGLIHIFTPIIIENTIHGMLGVSGQNLEDTNYIHDILRLISTRISGVLTNATLHRNTKLLALTDGLSGLLNRRAFHERLKSEYERFLRYGSHLSLIVADFDNLKNVNDNYGHPLGDEVIKKIGDIFRETSRDSDVLARYGGDEFVIVLPETNAKNAYYTAERIRKKIEQYPFKAGDIQFHCTISMGVATTPNKGINSSQDLLESADRALYEAKRFGRNRVTLASY